MKIRPTLPLALMSAVLGAAPANDFVRQIQVINGTTVMVDIPVWAAAGQVTSHALRGDLSIFQLYAAHPKPDQGIEFLKLDELSVGTFLPQVVIETFSEDPHVPTTTRADRPYGVRVTVSGMREGDEVPEFARSVLVGRGFKVYSPVTCAPTGEGGEYTDTLVFRTNGVYEEADIYQQLPGDHPTLCMGAETIAAYVRPEAGPELGRLAAAEVIVWPVGSARIEHIEQGKTYHALPDNGQILLRDAYPRSTSYARIYKGPPRLGAAGTVIETTVTRLGKGGNNPKVPQNLTVPIGRVHEYIDSDGEYTIEVLTVTPFNGGAQERLAHVSFFVDGTIAVRGMIVTMEGDD